MLTSFFLTTLILTTDTLTNSYIGYTFSQQEIFIIYNSIMTLAYPIHHPSLVSMATSLLELRLLHQLLVHSLFVGQLVQSTSVLMGLKAEMQKVGLKICDYDIKTLTTHLQ